MFEGFAKAQRSVWCFVFPRKACIACNNLCRFYTGSDSRSEHKCYRMLDLLRAARRKYGSAAALEAAWMRAAGFPAANYIEART